MRLLHESFDYYLAVVQRLDPDGSLRVVAGAGPLAEEFTDFLATEQPVEVGVNGRVARSGRAAMVNDTRLDSDYLTRNPRTDPGSELSLPISVAGSIWGVMNLEQEQPGAFAEEDLLLAHVVASQVGAAIHRCQLVDGTGGRLPHHRRRPRRRGRAAGRLHRRPRQRGRRPGRRGRRTDGHRRRRAGPAPLRRPAARRRQDRHPRRDPPQARPADRRGARAHGRAHRDRRPHARAHPLPRPGRAAGPLRPRALRRRRLPRRPRRRARSPAGR